MEVLCISVVLTFDFDREGVVVGSDRAETRLPIKPGWTEIRRVVLNPFPGVIVYRKGSGEIIDG